MSSSKPSVLFDPGAWHSPEAYEGLISRLQDFEYSCVALDLPSVEATPPKHLDDDVETIYTAIQGIEDNGKDCIVFMLSYGGVVGCEAMKGLSSAVRSGEGKQRVAIKLLFVAAYALLEGKSVVDPGVDIQSKHTGCFEVKGGDILVTRSREIFYNDLSEEVAEQCTGS